ncbi:MAG: ATP-binding protein [Candidatus Methylumidiphilus sp.]
MKLTSGIQFHLSLLGILPAGLIGLALAAYFIATRLADLEKNLDMRGELILHGLAAAAPAIAGDGVALQNLVDTLLKEDDVLEVGILGRHGNALATGGKPQKQAGLAGEWVRTALIFPTPLPPAAPASAFARGAVSPLSPRPESLGTVRLVLSRSDTFRQQGETVLFSLLALLAGSLATVPLARHMARKISDPVVALTIAVHELSKGNMDARAESVAEAELAYLQAGFNAMAAELKKNRDSLEQQVRSATARLHEALADLEKRNQELESARWAAESQTELKSRFLAQMSHEIRTPLNGIIGFAELLAKTPLGDEQAEKLGLITRSAKNLLSIINEILDLAKLEAGKISLDIQAFALRPCLEDIVALLSVRGSAPPVALWIAAEAPVLIEGDAVRIQQAVANLLGNALKFTRRGKIVVRVRVLAGRAGERLMFSVSDSGSGISTQDQAKLFSPFQQLGERTATAESGAGLGLSIVKKIVESMGGGIHLASRLGRGTTLWFDVPLARVDEGAPDSPLPMLVGLVEADRVFRLACLEQLRGLGATVEAFADVDSLYRRFAAAPCPAALLFGVCPQREKSAPALPGLLEWCAARGVGPILVFPSGERRLLNYYRKRGAVCLSHPLRSDVLAKAASCPARAPAAAPPAPAPRGHRFLVVDDNEINRLLLREQLRGFAAETVEAGNGSEALEHLRQQRFDVVLLDLQMPLMDGQQVLRELRGYPGPNRHVTVIAITAYCAPGQRETVIAEGFDDCLIKPITQGQLLAFLATRLGLAPSQPSADATCAAYALAIIERAGGNADLAGLITRKIYAELPDSLRQTQAALRHRDREAAQNAVHKINGAAAFAGLLAIRQAAVALESALRRGEQDWEGLASLGQDLAREADGFLAVESLLLDRIGGGGGTPGLRG